MVDMLYQDVMKEALNLANAPIAIFVQRKMDTVISQNKCSMAITQKDPIDIVKRDYKK